ncbi:hypothetical protein [Streptomyces sp. AP-93]|uniref:hypothetical protein n=1 Tax=Streptomyces sp. AP-93 TaxID=2929048 RepID=UPI001FAFB4F9|nr:hypothetical protein [Streptomyces sp. AP-93]MCJ0872087.1 hypothetical protein [Streptomyces sp. AP-93]
MNPPVFEAGCHDFRGSRGMLIVYALYLLIVLVLTAAPGAALGFGCIAVSRGRARAARIALLLALGAACATLWLLAVGVDSHWAPPIAGMSFAGTLIAGFTTLGRQNRRLLAQQYEALPWPPWPPAATGR